MGTQLRALFTPDTQKNVLHGYSKKKCPKYFKHMERMI